MMNASTMKNASAAKNASAKNPSSKKGISGWPGRIWPIVFWIAVWQLASMYVGYGIFLASPLQTLERLVSLCQSPAFYLALIRTTGRIMTGFLPAVLAGVVLAVLTVHSRLAESVIMPAVRVIRTVPVASFIILALILVSSRYLTQLISFTMAMPVICLNMQTALRQRDERMEEMADIYRIPRLRKIRYMTIPRIFPAFETSTILALSFAWKSGIAAEVIGIPVGSIGEKLQQAKTYLATPDLFAWTAVVVLLSFLTEYIWKTLTDWAFRLLLKREISGRKLPEGELPGDDDTGIADHADNAFTAAIPAIALSHISKSFDGRDVVQDFSHVFEAGGTYAILGDSGTGKTTLLRMIAGLEQPDGGEISCPKQPGGTERPERDRSGSSLFPKEAMCGPVSMMFQENRLLDHLSGKSNLLFACPFLTDRKIWEDMLSLGFEAEDAEKAAGDYSGGMKRRLAFLRCICYPGQPLLLDEPFSGLDPENTRRAVRFLMEHRDGRTVIVTAHDEAEAELLGAEKIYIT